MSSNVTGLLEVDRLISVNSLYINVRSGKNKCLSPAGRDFKERLAYELIPTRFDLSEYDFFELEIDYYLKDRFLQRDANNFDKAVIDSIFSAFNIDDRFLISSKSTKHKLSSPDKEALKKSGEYIRFRLTYFDYSESDQSVDLDKIRRGL